VSGNARRDGLAQHGLHAERAAGLAGIYTRQLLATAVLSPLAL